MHLYNWNVCRYLYRAARALIVLVPITLLSNFAFSQQKEVVDEVITARKQVVTEHYNNSEVGSIITGRRYIAINDGFGKEHFFESRDLVSGTLIYDNSTRNDIEIQYDLYGQQIALFIPQMTWGRTRLK